MKKLTANFRQPHFRLNVAGVALILATIVQVVASISIDWPPSHTAPMHRSGR